jgi:uncharacterized protein YjbI with pentapeptide repeats
MQQPINMRRIKFRQKRPTTGNAGFARQLPGMPVPRRGHPLFPWRCRLRRAGRCLVVLLVLLGGGFATTECLAQRSVKLELAVTNQNSVVLAWQSQSVIPPPGFEILPDYQVYRSQDLRNWLPIGGRLTAAEDIGRGFTVTDSVNGTPLTFYRVESILDLPYAALSGKDLGNGDLRHANLFGANLFAAKLHNTTQRDAFLRGADLRFASITNSSLVEADLFAARLFGANLQETDLSGVHAGFADFGFADLFAASFRDADLTSAVLTGANLRFVALHGAVLDDSTLLDSKTRLIWQIVNEGANGMDLSNRDLSFADVSSADFQNASLRFANLFGLFAFGADLRGADLQGADIRFIDLRQALLDDNTRVIDQIRMVWEILNVPDAPRDFPGGNFASTLLTGADLADANLANCNFSSAILNLANLAGADLTSATLINALLRDADLTGANLTRANLRNANLTGTILDGALFDETIMPDGSLRTD